MSDHGNEDDELLEVTVQENETPEDKQVDLYEILQKFNSFCQQGNKTQIKKLSSFYRSLKRNETLGSFNNATFSSSQSKYKYKRRVIDSILRNYYNELQDDKNECLYPAAATFDLRKLEELIENMSEEDINHMRNSDSVIVFVLKYGDISNENFLSCIEILINAGVDINKFDGTGKSAIDYIALLYENHKSDTNVTENLKQLASLLLDKGIYKTENNKTEVFLETTLEVKLSDYTYRPMEDSTKLFYWIIKNKPDDFVKFKYFDKIDINCDNGEDTLLQFACRKSDNMFPVVQCLLKKGADPNRVTKWNPLTPLELAGKRNHAKIFEELLKHKNTRLELKHYQNFVRWRSQPMKTKLFERLLESDKLDSNFTYDKTGNTPLHYAIIFSHKNAVENLLKRKSSLVSKNKFSKSAIDLIDKEDLEQYFDSCLALDNYTPYFTDINYKMKFRFNCLIDDINCREMNIVSKIGKNSHLEHLLRHPFIHTFISLKWYKTKFYFKLCLVLQAFFFLLLSILFYRLPGASVVETSFCILLSAINAWIKIPVFCNYKILHHRPIFFVIEQATLHASTELILILTCVGSFFQDQFRAFVFIEMAIAFLLSAGYHPKLSKWSLMLQRVFQTFTMLLLFFSLIVVAFSVGFHILLANVKKGEDNIFSNSLTSVYKTYIMTTGEFETDDLIESSGFAASLLMLLFAMSVSLVIVNFWTGVAVTDIERIEKHSEINAFKNVLIFLTFVDYIYSLSYLRKLRKYVPKPLLFLNLNENYEIYHDVHGCEVDFYVNKGRQFEDKNLPRKIDDECNNKIRLHYYKLKEVTKEQQILLKLDELSKLINNELLKISKIPKQDAADSSQAKQNNSNKQKFRNKK